MSVAPVEQWPIEEVEARWQDVETAIADKGQYRVAPWQPLRGESRLDFLTFQAYLNNPERSMVQTAVTMSLDPDRIRHLFRSWEWERRAQLFDVWADRQADDARAEVIRRIADENGRAFAKLPELVASCQQLVQGSLTAIVREQEDAAASGMPFDPLPLSSAMKLAETMRGLMEATNRFLGLKVEVTMSIDGKVRHEHTLTPTPTDALNMLAGLRDANLLPGAQDAIEASSKES